MFDSVQCVQEGTPDVVVLFHFEGRKPEPNESPFFAHPLVVAAMSRKECTGETDNLVEAQLEQDGRVLRVYVVGLGKREKFHTDQLRKVAGILGRQFAKTKEECLSLDVAETLHAAEVEQKRAAQCLGEGFGLLGWQAKRFSGTGTKDVHLTPLRLLVSNHELAVGVDYGLSLAASTNFCRDLSQTPPNIATPLWIAQKAQEIADSSGLKCTIFSGDALQEEKLQGLISVGAASENPPCMIRLEYRPEEPTDAAPILLLGKTITYDTGGLTLKPRESMVGMKRDKDGGCAVLGAMHAVGTLLKPKFPVVALLVAAENSVSNNSMRPDDIITYRNGVTVEITNTDAEGRLVLADGLCWACEVEKPTCIVDLATLTGGVVVALGSTYAGYFCEDDSLCNNLELAAQRSGERVWRLPMHQEYKDMMKSPVADLQNSNPGRKAHPIQGAAFLSAFVSDSIPWAHIDIAGVHATDADNGVFVKGPTGYGVRLLAELIDLLNEAAE